LNSPFSFAFLVNCTGVQYRQSWSEKA
jgi:hypothetical protein